MIRSKAYVSTEEMGDQYCLIGPYKEATARTEVEEGPLGSPLLNEAVNLVRAQGFKVRIIPFNYIGNLIRYRGIRCRNHILQYYDTVSNSYFV